MNKKIKNIASVVQTKSAAVLCTLCAVLFLASCAEDEMADGTHSQKQDLRTVSVNFDMPADKPSFGDGTASRAALDAQPAEILLGDSTLAVSRTSSDTYYTTTSWANNDELLVKIEAGSTEARLTLKFITLNAPISDGEPQAAIAGTWYLMKSKSYVKYTGNAFTAYNEQGVTPLFAEVNGEDSEKLPINGTLTMHIDYSSVATQATVSIIYAPDMEWSLAQDNTVSMEQKNPATTAITAPVLWTVGINGWVTNQARLRVYTGAEGDVVTLTSSAFDSAWEVEPTEGIYTATTDAQGNAYFYGRTSGTLTDNFLVELTQMRVPVPTATPTSEGRSITLEGKSTLLIDLDEPITLLEASDVVPVTLTATKAYRIKADVKREASAVANLSVIDGSVGGKTEGTADDVAAVKAQIETAMAMGITEFTVINQLAMYTDEDTYIYAGSVVGEAIRQLVPEAVPSSARAVNGNCKISLTLDDATVVPELAFFFCEALQSVTAPAATSIGEYAFAFCSGLTSVSLPNATTIDDYAFSGTGLTGELSLPAATTIGISAFQYCTALMSVSLPNATTIDDYAFVETGLTGELSLPAAETIGVAAFQKCTVLTKVVADKATTIGMSAFQSCTALMCVSLPKATTIGVAAFQGCAALTTVLFGTAVTGLGDMAFDNVPTENCDLTLAEGQREFDGDDMYDGKWAGKKWQTITVGTERRYPYDGPR